jgi:protein TonB
MIVATLGVMVALLAGCSSKPAPSPATSTPPAAPVVVPGPTAKAPPPSVARTPKEYRQDAARHLYQLNAVRIYKGRLPPVLVDRQGNVVALNWLRAPKHAPEVVAEIERTARAAAPYPVPERLGRVTYTDTWLWDKSGRFQLDTLTEGQD